MGKGKSPKPADRRTLRERAEALAQHSEEDIPRTSPEEIRELVHDLHTHQIELEMQNEELQQAQVDLLEAQERLTELYDFAPVGYITVGRKGIITEANLMAGSMLGRERALLIGQPLSAFVVHEEQDAYYRHRMLSLKAEKELSCTLKMRKNSSEQFWAEMQSAPVADDTARDFGLS